MRTTPMKKVALKEKLTGPTEPLYTVQVRSVGMAASEMALAASGRDRPGCKDSQAATSGDPSVKGAMGATTLRI